MSEKDFVAFIDYIHGSLTEYKECPMDEYDEKYRDAVMDKVGTEGEQSSQNAPRELLNEAKEAFRKAYDEMSRMKTRYQIQKRGLEIPCMN